MNKADMIEQIAQAAEILIRQLAIFTDLERIEGFGAEAAPLEGAMVDVQLAHGMENFPIEELELGVERGPVVGERARVILALVVRQCPGGLARAGDPGGPAL